MRKQEYPSVVAQFITLGPQINKAQRNELRSYGCLWRARRNELRNYECFMYNGYYFLRRSSTRALAVLDSPPLARGKLSAATSSTCGVLPVTDFTASAICLLKLAIYSLLSRIALSFTSTFKSKVSRPLRLSTMIRKFA